jgi:transcriptional regulator with XRE-family HTH domain
MSILILQMILTHFFSLSVCILAIFLILYPELGKILRRIRGDRTQENFALDMNISVKSVKRFERGEMPSSRLAYRIAKSDNNDEYIRTWEEIEVELRKSRKEKSAHLARLEDMLVFDELHSYSSKGHLQ